MGGTSTSTQQSQQQSQLTPWAPAASGLQGILGALDPSIATLAGTPLENQAFGQLEANAQAPNPYAAPVQNAALTQLRGGPNYGAATNAVTSGYDATRAALAPYATGNATDPTSNPALGTELATVAQDVANQVNPMFAAAGRLGSPSNYQAVARGITQGAAPILQNAATNQIQAGGILSGAANTAGNTLGGLDVGNAGILGQGIANAPHAYAVPNLGPQALLAAAQAQQQLPISNAGLLSSIYDQPAAQFGTQNSSGSTTGTQTASPLQQLLMGTQAFDNLLSPFKTNQGLKFPFIS